MLTPMAPTPPHKEKGNEYTLVNRNRFHLSELLALLLINNPVIFPINIVLVAKFTHSSCEVHTIRANFFHIHMTMFLIKYFCIQYIEKMVSCPHVMLRRCAPSPCP